MIPVLQCVNSFVSVISAHIELHCHVWYFKTILLWYNGKFKRWEMRIILCLALSLLKLWLLYSDLCAVQGTGLKPEMLGFDVKSVYFIPQTWVLNVHVGYKTKAKA